MANSWENRVKFIVRYMYDYDGNGVLDKNDFEVGSVYEKFSVTWMWSKSSNCLQLWSPPLPPPSAWQYVTLSWKARGPGTLLSKTGCSQVMLLLLLLLLFSVPTTFKTTTTTSPTHSLFLLKLSLWWISYFRYEKNKAGMMNLWNEISDIADFDKVAASSGLPLDFLLLLLLLILPLPFTLLSPERWSWHRGVHGRSKDSLQGKKVHRASRGFQVLHWGGGYLCIDFCHDDVLRLSSGLLMLMAMALLVRNVIVLGQAGIEVFSQQ